MVFTLKFFPCWSLFENFHNKVKELRIVYSNTLLKLYKTLGQKFSEVYHRYRASLVAHTIKNLPAMEEPWVGKILWRRKWQPPPVFLPGKSHGQRSLAGYSPWSFKECNMPEHTHNSCSQGMQNLDRFWIISSRSWNI